MKNEISIRPPKNEDAEAFLDAVRRSWAFHRGWVSPPHTQDAYSRYVERVTSDGHRGFLVIHEPSGGLVGVINVNNIIRGAFCSAFLGYYAFSDFAGQGHMKRGMSLVLRHAFRELRLHRVEANIQPENEASRALVRACGFSKEGYSKRYLKIGGRWRDHERWALLSEDFGRAV